MSSKSHAVIITEHLQSRFHWWYSLYTSLLEVKAAYEKDQPFSSDPYGDAAILDALIDDVDWAYRMSQALAEELGRAESALNAPKPKPQPKPQPAPAPEPEPDVSDIPFAAVDAQPVDEVESEWRELIQDWDNDDSSQPAPQPAPKRKPRKPYKLWVSNYKWPVLTPRVIRVPVLGEVS